MSFISTKTYGHEMGFSCAFRQWRAQSHCRLVHGYSMGFKFIFEAQNLDVRNWVVDFGGLEPLKQILKDNFDHTTIVAEDDPELDWFKEADRRGILRLVVFPAAGCEKFAEMLGQACSQLLRDMGYGTRVALLSCEVREHGANSAIWVNDNAGQE